MPTDTSSHRPSSSIQPSMRPSDRPSIQPSISIEPSQQPSNSFFPSNFPTVPRCDVNGECDDYNPCTINKCDATARVCQFTPISDCTNGAILETWLGIEGRIVPDLTSNENYPNSPNSSTILSSTLDVCCQGDNLGNRMRTFIYPPVSGQYTFFLSSDDNAELWLSSNEDPSNAQIIAFMGTNTAPRWSSKHQVSIRISLLFYVAFSFESFLISSIIHVKVG